MRIGARDYSKLAVGQARRIGSGRPCLCELWCCEWLDGGAQFRDHQDTARSHADDLGCRTDHCRMAWSGWKPRSQLGGAFCLRQRSQSEEHGPIEKYIKQPARWSVSSEENGKVPVFGSSL